MIPKPEICQDCPLWGDGLGFVPDALVENAPLVIVMQNPGSSEEKGERITGYDGPRNPVTEPCAPQPAIGATGYQMDRGYIPLTGFTRDQVSVLNILKCRMTVGGKRTNDMPTGKMWEEAVSHCMKAHFRLPQGTKLILAQGAHAWRALGGPSPISEWRGHLLPGGFDATQYLREGSPRDGLCRLRGESNSPIQIPVLGTLHLADLVYDPNMELCVKRDWRKVPSILKGEWPRKVPETILVTHMNRSRIEWWFEQASKAPFVAIDTEYHKETRELNLIGLGIPGDYPTLQCEWWHAEKGPFSLFVDRFLRLVRETPVIFQNALADVPVIRQAKAWRGKTQLALGLDWKDYRRIEDTMQAHHVLWSELPHDLEFLASIYGRYPKMKHLQGKDQLRYNQGDVLETISVWEALERELENDPQSRGVYETHLRLLPIVDESMQRGIAVDTKMVEERIGLYGGKVAIASKMAHAFCGWPINLESDDQLSHWMYGVEGMTPQKPRKKHGVAKGKVKGNTINKDARAVLRTAYLPFDPDEDDDPSEESTLKRIEDGGHPLLEAKHLHSNAAQCLKNYLYPLVKED